MWEGEIARIPFYRHFESAELKRASEHASTVEDVAPCSMEADVRATRVPLIALRTRAELGDGKSTKAHIATGGLETARKNNFCDEGPERGASLWQFTDIIATARPVSEAVANHAGQTAHGYYAELTLK